MLGTSCATKPSICFFLLHHPTPAGSRKRHGRYVIFVTPPSKNDIARNPSQPDGQSGGLPLGATDMLGHLRSVRQWKLPYSVQCCIPSLSDTQTSCCTYCTPYGLYIRAVHTIPSMVRGTPPPLLPVGPRQRPSTRKVAETWLFLR